MNTKASRLLLATAAATWLSACAGNPEATPTVAGAKDPTTTPNGNSGTAPPTVGAAARTAQEATLSLRLDNGVALRIGRTAEGRDARLQVGVLAGSLSQAPSLADLATHVLVDSADPAQGRGSLRQAIEQLGGSLHVHTGPLTTWIDVLVPADQWRAAAEALRTAVTQPPQSRSQVDRIRELRLAACADAVRRDPVMATAEQLLLGERDPADHMHGLQDRDASEVSLFVGHFFRPERVVWLLETARPPEEVAAAFRRGGAADLSGWSPPMAPGIPAVLDRRFDSGVFWAPDDAEVCDVAMVLLLPTLVANSAPLYVLQDCLTLDGTGGRFEQMQRERGPADVRWRSALVQGSDATALVLRARLSPADAAAAWRTLQLSRQSLRDVAPNASELQLARRRAPLTARLAVLDPGARMRTETRLQTIGESLADFDARLVILEQHGLLAPPAAVEEFLKLPVAMVVAGGTPPADLAGVRRLQLLPAGLAASGPGATTNPAGQPAPKRTTGAEPWLAHAMEVVGGADKLRRFDGWAAVARTEHAEAPTLLDETACRLGATLHRERELLGQKIVTDVGTDAGTERLGNETKPLPPGEVAQLWREARRHPLALLAAHARGELAFEVVAKRTVGDRDHVVLQASGDPQRLRVHLDAESHLVRLVEVWDTMADGSVVHLEEAWDDYRATGGLRAPFQRTCTQDDGRNRLRTTFAKWQPSFRRP
jgi:hypothetical protein